MVELVAGVSLDGCVVCRGALVDYDRFESFGSELRYVVCTRCGLVLLDPRPSQEALDAFYEEEYRRDLGDEEGEGTGSTQRRRALQQQAFIARRPQRHLDVGCSLGDLLVAVDATVKIGVEPGIQHRDLLAARGITGFETLEDLVATDPEPFDLISMSHVLEHLDDPAGFVAQLAPLIAPGGELFIEVPYLYRSLAYTREHLSVFTQPSLESTLLAGGFEVRRHRMHVHPQGALGPGRNLAVLAAPVAPVVPTSGSVNVSLMKARRKVGFGSQQLRRWFFRRRRRMMLKLGIPRRSTRD